MTTSKIDAKTPRGQLSQVYKTLAKIAEELGQNPEEEIVVFQEDYFGKPCWKLSWESGPDQWAFLATSGEDIFHHEMAGFEEEFGYAVSEEPTFDFADHVELDHDFSFDICFYKRKSISKLFNDKGAE